MTHKEGQKKITLDSIMKELRSFRAEIFERIEKLDKEHEQYFTAIQDSLLDLNKRTSNLETDVSVLKSDVGQLKTDVSGLKTDTSDIKKDLKEFRTETKSFHSGFAAKSGRQDAFRFNLVGILEEKKILSLGQANDLRTI